MAEAILCKRCSRCDLLKSRDIFNVRRSSADGLRGVCRQCHSEENRESYLRHQERRKAEGRVKMAAWREDASNARKNREDALAWYRLPQNMEIAKRRAREWSERNPEQRTETARDWRVRNPGVWRAAIKRYKMKKRNATPAWANLFFIQEAYDIAAKRSEATGFPWHVDHIVPIRSPLVCGLHVEANLAVIPASVNLSKSNFYWPDMP